MEIYEVGQTFNSKIANYTTKMLKISFTANYICNIYHCKTDWLNVQVYHTLTNDQLKQNYTLRITGGTYSGNQTNETTNTTYTSISYTQNINITSRETKYIPGGYISFTQNNE